MRRMFRQGDCQNHERNFGCDNDESDNNNHYHLESLRNNSETI